MADAELIFAERGSFGDPGYASDVTIVSSGDSSTEHPRHLDAVLVKWVVS